MKLLFVHAHKFRNINGSLYSPGGLSNEILTRYVNYFGDVTVIARIINEDKTKSSYSLISNPHVTITTNIELERLVKESDAIIVRLPCVNGYKACYLAKKYNKPCLVEVVGCIWDAYWNYSLKGKIVALPAMLIMKRCVKSATNVVYVSQHFLQHRYPTNGKSVGISDVEILPADNDVLQKRMKTIDSIQGKIIIGTIAALNVPFKGQAHVIRAIPEIERKTGMQVEYQLVGGGDASRLVEEAKSVGVESRLNVIGVLPHSEVFEWLDNIDIYIQSSKQEGLCRSIVEAMSRGCVCIASDVGGNSELIDNDFIFSLNPKKLISKEISDIIYDVLNDKKMKQVAKRNYDYSNTAFDRELLAEQRDQFYLDFIKDEVSKCQQ